MNKCCLKSSKYKLIFSVNMLTNFVIRSLKIQFKLGLMACKTNRNFRKCQWFQPKPPYV